MKFQIRREYDDHPSMVLGYVECVDPVLTHKLNQCRFQTDRDDVYHEMGNALLGLWDAWQEEYRRLEEYPDTDAEFLEFLDRQPGWVIADDPDIYVVPVGT